MNAINTYFVDVLKNHYIDFKGHASRTQFWMYTLFSFVAMLLVGIIVSFLGETLGKIIMWLIYLAFLLPNLGIAARRLRDGGFSPWLLLISLIPALGNLVLLILFCLPTKK